MQDLITVGLDQVHAFSQFRDDVVIEIRQEVPPDVHFEAVALCGGDQRIQHPQAVTLDAAQAAALHTVARVHAVKNSRQLSAQNHPVKGPVLGDVLHKLEFDTRGLVRDLEPALRACLGPELDAVAQGQVEKIVQQGAVKGDALQLLCPAIAEVLVVALLKHGLADQIVPLPVPLAEEIRGKVQAAPAAQREFCTRLHRLDERLGGF